MMEPIKISVIIPTLNAEAYLEELVGRLKTQQQEVAQIMIIDSGSGDGTVDLATSLGAKVITINPDCDSFDHGATRNRAAELAEGNILIFMTQDALPANNETIGRLIKPLESDLTVVSYARQIAFDRASSSEKFLRLANYPPRVIVKSSQEIKQMGIKTFQNSNVCSAYRRAEFEKLGRFPAPVVCNEDMLFAAKAIFAGYRVCYNADALVLHNHALKIKDLFRRYFDIAASLDHEPRIKTFGQTEAKGLDFFRNQLNYLRDQKKLHELPRVICETAAKYLGYKCGTNHNRIPKKLKTYFGLNRAYWRRQA